MTLRKLLQAGAVFAFTLVPCAMAQDAAKPLEDPYTIAEILDDGGTIGWVIVAVSVVMLAMVIEDAVTIRRDKLHPPDLTEEIDALLEAGDFQEAMELCEAQPNMLTNVIAAGLPRLSHGFDSMETSMTEMVEEEALKLHAKVGWLSFIASVATMLGLLGTIQGMVVAFRVIAATKGQADPSQLSDGISAALITTLQGLIVAIPSSFFFTFFRNKIVRHTLEVAAITEDLIDRFRPKAAA